MIRINKIKIELAVQTILAILLLVFALHILILSGVIPYQYVWGGQLENHAQMVQFQSVAMLITLCVIFVVLIKGKYIPAYLSRKWMQVLLWIFTIFFALNTLGNLLSLNSLETIIATPFTCVLALMFLRLARDKTE